MAPWNAGRKLPAQLYDSQEVNALLAACGQSRTGKRNKVLIALLAGDGLRCAEALALEPDDVSFELRLIRVPHGEGDRQRTVPLDALTASLIER